jgi:zinc transport system substrate-binding protein
MLSRNMKKVKKYIILLVCAVLLVFFAGCGNNGSNSGKKIIAVTIVPEAAFVKAVCGDNFDIVTLVPPGGSPESYEPSPMIIEKFEDAVIYFQIGVPVESSSAVTNIPANVKVVKLHEEVAKVYPDLVFDEGERDHHTWLSPKRVKVMIDTILAEICEIDPENTQFYKDNAASFINELDKTDKEIKKAFEGIEDPKFIAYHPAFGYFATEYNLTMYALEEEGKEVTISRLKDMVDLAKAENINTIFYQEETDAARAKAFADEICGKAVMLSPLSGEYIDNLKDMAAKLAESMK